MSLYLPEELRWLGWVAGAPWPDGDEDQVWEVSAAWRDASRQLTDLLAAVEQARQATAQAYPVGEGSEQMAARYDDLRAGNQSMETLAKHMKIVADSIFDFGTEVQGLKLNIVVVLSWLAAEIAWAWLFPLTAPAVTKAAILSTRSILKVLQDAVQNAIQDLVRRTGVLVKGRHFWGSLSHGRIVAPTAKGWGVYSSRILEAAVISAAIDGSVQAGQLIDGTRRHFNGGQFGLSILAAGAGALPAREVGRYLGKATETGLDKIAATTGRDMNNAWVRTGRGALVGATADGVGGLFGSIATGTVIAATGGNFADPFTSGSGWVGHVAQGALVGGARGAFLYDSYIPTYADGYSRSDRPEFRRANPRAYLWFSDTAWHRLVPWVELGGSAGTGAGGAVGSGPGAGAGGPAVGGDAVASGGLGGGDGSSVAPGAGAPVAGSVASEGGGSAAAPTGSGSAGQELPAGTASSGTGLPTVSQTTAVPVGSSDQVSGASGTTTSPAIDAPATGPGVGSGGSGSDITAGGPAVGGDAVASGGLAGGDGSGTPPGAGALVAGNAASGGDGSAAAPTGSGSAGQELPAGTASSGTGLPADSPTTAVPPGHSDPAPTGSGNPTDSPTTTAPAGPTDPVSATSSSPPTPVSGTPAPGAGTETGLPTTSVHDAGPAPVQEPATVTGSGETSSAPGQVALPDVTATPAPTDSVSSPIPSPPPDAAHPHHGEGTELSTIGSTSGAAADQRTERPPYYGDGQDLRGKARPLRWPEWQQLPTEYRPPEAPAHDSWLPEGAAPRPPGPGSGTPPGAAATAPPAGQPGEPTPAVAAHDPAAAGAAPGEPSRRGVVPGEGLVPSAGYGQSAGPGVAPAPGADPGLPSRSAPAPSTVTRSDSVDSPRSKVAGDAPEPSRAVRNQVVAAGSAAAPERAGAGAVAGSGSGGEQGDRSPHDPDTESSVDVPFTLHMTTEGEVDRR